MTLPPDVTDHPARILIVDDEPHNRHLLEVMLAAEGYLLQSAASGAEALALIRQQPPDLVLLDVMMPEMSGYDVATRVKADPLSKNIPIIMVTVRDDREAKMLGLGAGAEDFLSKPVDRAELRVRVRNLLRLKAYGDYHDRYSQMLENEVGSRTAHLLQSEARYRRIVETGSEGVWVVDAEGLTSFMNARMAQMLGADLGRVVGTSPVTFLFEDAAAIFAASLEGLKAGDARQLEVRFRRADGTTLWSLVETSPIFAADGTFEGALAMVMDVSARHDAEEALRASTRIAELSGRSASPSRRAACSRRCSSAARMPSSRARAPLARASGPSIPARSRSSSRRRRDRARRRTAERRSTRRCSSARRDVRSSRTTSPTTHGSAIARGPRAKGSWPLPATRCW